VRLSLGDVKVTLSELRPWFHGEYVVVLHDGTQLKRVERTSSVPAPSSAGFEGDAGPLRRRAASRHQRPARISPVPNSSTSRHLPERRALRRPEIPRSARPAPLPCIALDRGDRLALAAADIAHSQSFTRILDPTNPVVTDAYESGGGAWVDVDDDGDLDLFVSHGNLSNQDNALYLNQGSGQFTKVTTGAIVHDGGTSIGSTWADYDADGHLDCFVTNRNNFGNFLYRGIGAGQFVRVTGVPPAADFGNSNSSSWVDLVAMACSTSTW
jgi:hypothetical protein